MSAELIGILSVGVALGGLVLALQVRTDRRLDARQVRTDRRLDAWQVRTDRRLDRIEAKMDRELAALRTELRQLGVRVARIEGAALFRSADVPAQAPTGD